MSDSEVKSMTVIKWVCVACLILVVVSFIFPNWSAPADWLVAWTSWFGMIAAIVAGTRFLWFGSMAARKYILGQK